MKRGKPLERRSGLQADPEKAMDWQRRSMKKAQENVRARSRAAVRAPKAPPGRSLPRKGAGREKRQIAPERKIEHPRPVDRVVRPVGARKQDWDDVAGLKCVICGSTRVVRHHTVYEQEVDRCAPNLLWDVRNRTPICGADHMRHHDGSDWRIPLSALPDAVFEFAAEILGDYAPDYLRRRYGGEDLRLDELMTQTTNEEEHE